jgi:hypothetical protein
MPMVASQRSHCSKRGSNLIMESEGKTPESVNQQKVQLTPGDVSGLMVEVEGQLTQGRR